MIISVILITCLLENFFKLHIKGSQKVDCILKGRSSFPLLQGNLGLSFLCDGNLGVNKILCRILLLFTSIITISLSIDEKKPAFLLKLAFPCHTTDYSIYCVLKIGTRRLFGCRVISLSLCTILFVPILLSRKQLPPIVFVSYVEGINYRYGRHSMTDCS